jgi:hypothetical protein
MTCGQRRAYVATLYLLGAVSLTDLFLDYVPTQLSAGLFALNVVLLVRLIEHRRATRVVVITAQRRQGDR